MVSLGVVVDPEESLVVVQELVSSDRHLEMMGENLETCLVNHVVDRSWLETLDAFDLDLEDHVDLVGCHEESDRVVVDVA